MEQNKHLVAEWKTANNERLSEIKSANPELYSAINLALSYLNKTLTGEELPVEIEVETKPKSSLSGWTVLTKQDMQARALNDFGISPQAWEKLYGTPIEELYDYQSEIDDAIAKLKVYNTPPKFSRGNLSGYGLTPSYFNFVQPKEESQTQPTSTSNTLIAIGSEFDEDVKTLWRKIKSKFTTENDGTRPSPTQSAGVLPSVWNKFTDPSDISIMRNAIENSFWMKGNDGYWYKPKEDKSSKMKWVKDQPPTPYVSMSIDEFNRMIYEPLSSLSAPVDLRDTKIKVNNEQESRAFQEFAFNQGAAWWNGKKLMHGNDKYLFIDQQNKLTSASLEKIFQESSAREITLDQLGISVSSEQTQVFKVGDKVKMPKTKQGMVTELYGSGSYRNAQDNKQDYLIVNKIEGDKILLWSVLHPSNSGDIYSISKDNIELYEQQSTQSNQAPVVKTDWEPKDLVGQVLKNRSDRLLDVVKVVRNNPKMVDFLLRYQDNGSDFRLKISRGAVKAFMNGKSVDGWSRYEKPIQLEEEEDFSKMNQAQLIAKRDEIKEALDELSQNDPEYTILKEQLNEIEVYID